MAVSLQWPATLQECYAAIERLTQDISVLVQETEGLLCNSENTPEELEWIQSNQYNLVIKQADLEFCHALKERFEVEA